MKILKTTTPKITYIQQEWHFIDVRGRILGDAAQEIAKLLIGKNKAIYTPNINVGDKVVVLNSKKVAVTGRKLDDKTYYRHTGYPGGIRNENLRSLLDRRPNEVIRRAVKNMLPKNKLQKIRMANLYIYEGDQHPHEAQQK
ncbi:50S ribosomal protein L13 [Candidatus Nomurabacteria bacterium]|uniref:Large ribosomal subunit protein uL13 n=1 Tax=candidate division WWE3 bacterium TaxID=2053526 RepID=A0A955IWH1_UNCKA|nr:50S ribosomal protein L13 [candidate division WWE3 bacterium]MCB9823754.1 50S ribosomal protein L13 [Candidatus Nomurabacteria bacterium]MCB9826840.1 50S ribosomal protein L13 [Candidatus Nomurabacteria bacterium]MCB9827549.1 50S ribosomal protein L13 [Candidatus Nomurabacteria bacterium]HXK52426.1 50S ribosomal protein L13 [bacterium]